MNFNSIGITSREYKHNFTPKQLRSDHEHLKALHLTYIELIHACASNCLHFVTIYTLHI